MIARKFRVEKLPPKGEGWERVADCKFSFDAWALATTYYRLGNDIRIYNGRRVIKRFKWARGRIHAPA